MEKKSEAELRAHGRLEALLAAAESGIPDAAIGLGQASSLIRKVLAQVRGERAAALREIASVIERDWARLGTRSLILKTIRDRATAIDRMEKSEAELGPQKNEEVPVVQAQGATRDRRPRSPELTKAMRVLLSYIEEVMTDYVEEPAASEHLGRKITQRIIEAIGSTGQPESAEDALTRLLAALMEAQAARGRAEGQLLQQQDAQLRQEQDVVTDLRNKVQMLATERDGLLAAVNELKKGAGHGQLSARSQVGDRVQQPITGRWGTVMEVQGGRTLVRWDGAIAKPDGEDAEEESDEGASW